MLKLQNPVTNAYIIKNFEACVDRYEEEKHRIKATVKSYQKQYGDINLFDDQFDTTDAMLTISITMPGVTSLTQKNGDYISHRQ